MKDLNIKLRSKILELSLNFEETLDTLLTLYLSIFREDRKALSNKSSNLSAKNKIDLLYDLEILNKEEWEKFLLFTEFRNQFVHNINCNSFNEAVIALGKDKGKRLLKHTEEGSDDQEKKYLRAFECLFSECAGTIALTKIQKKSSHMEGIANFVKAQIKQNVSLIDEYLNSLNRLRDLCDQSFKSNPKQVAILSTFMEFYLNESKRGMKEIERIGKIGEEHFNKSTIMSVFFGRDVTTPNGFNEVLAEYLGHHDDKADKS